MIPKPAKHPILEAGFGFDFVDDIIIRGHGRIEKGALAISGSRFPIVILPDVERMPVETYRKLEAFVRAGGILIATRRTPSLAPGLAEAKAQSAKVRAISRRLFDGAKPPAHLVADEDTGLAPRLAALFRPDVFLSPPAPEIGFVHRGTNSAEIYFLANTAKTRRRTQATFRVPGLEPEWWNPFRGETAPARMEARPRGGVTVALDLEPYESRVLVFSRRRPPGGENASAPAPLPAPVDLSAGWKLTFDNPGRLVRRDTLRSWTDDPETRFYSGRATYEKTVSVPEDVIRPGIALCLDFGEGTAVPETGQKQPGMRAWLESPVREAAVVYVNGRRAGTVWRPPYAVEVTRLLRPGENALRVAVGNRAINRMAGGPPPDYGPLHGRYGRRFDPQDRENLRPLPSGLLGPIRLVAAAADSSTAVRRARSPAAQGRRPTANRERAINR